MPGASQQLNLESTVDRNAADDGWVVVFGIFGRPIYEVRLTDRQAPDKAGVRPRAVAQLAARLAQVLADPEPEPEG